MAEERVRIRLIIREIVQREGLVAEDARIRARIDEIVAAYEQPDEVRSYIYGDENELRRVELGVLEDRLVEHVLNHAQVESVSASYQDVVTGKAIPVPEVQTPPAGDAEIDKPRFEPDEDRGSNGPGRAPDVGETNKPPKGRLRRWLAGRRS